MLRTFAVGAFTVGLAATVFAHAELRMSSPPDGVSLGDTPTGVRLTFTERPEPSLSEITVSDGTGTRYDTGRPISAPDDPLSISVTVRPLATGVYTVTWRIMSAVDGHATAGAYTFGVRASPTAAPIRLETAGFSAMEAGARWIFACGLVLLLGAAAGHVAGFGGPRDLTIARLALMVSAAGLTLLAWAQLRTGATSLAAFLTTSIGRALLWRAAALAIGGIALGLAYSSARLSERRVHTGAMIVVGCAALAAMAFHVMAGHAAADPQPLLEGAVQWAHFAACGIWIGGLASLLLGLHQPSSFSGASARKFSTVAAGAIFIVLGTGVQRAFHEIAAWPDLINTAYGRVLLAKVSVFAIIATLGAFNRWRSVPMAATDPRLLKRTGRAELACATVALAAAALLGTLAPPVAARLVPGILVSGTDFGTTVRATFSAVSDQPGPNRFIVRIVDYDSKKPLHPNRVALRFTSLDHPDLPPTSLPLTLDSDDSYVGTGANVSLDGRWTVTVGIEREGGSVDVPLAVSVHVRAPRSREHP